MTIIGMIAVVVLPVTTNLQVALLRVNIDGTVVLLITVNDTVPAPHLTTSTEVMVRVSAGTKQEHCPRIQEEIAPVEMINLLTKFRNPGVEETVPDIQMEGTHLKASEWVEDMLEQTKTSTILRERIPWKLTTRVKVRLSSEENTVSTTEGHT